MQTLRGVTHRVPRRACPTRQQSQRVISICQAIGNLYESLLTATIIPDGTYVVLFESTACEQGLNPSICFNKCLLILTYLSSFALEYTRGGTMFNVRRETLWFLMTKKKMMRNNQLRKDSQILGRSDSCKVQPMRPPRSSRHRSLHLAMKVSS